MAIAAPSSTNGGYFLVCRQNSSSNSVGFGIYVQQNMTKLGAFDGASCLIEPEGGNSVIDKRYDLTVVKTTSGMSVTDGTHNDSISSTPRAMGSNLYVFAMYPYTGNNLTLVVCGRIYYLNIVEGGVEKLNFVPCVEDATEEIGFIDTVTGNFKRAAYNAGPVW